MARPGVRQKGLDNMKQISTGLGLAILGGCILGAGVLTSSRLGSSALAQGGSDRRIVGTSVYATANDNVNSTTRHYAYRIWSDNVIELRSLGTSGSSRYGDGTSEDYFYPTTRGSLAVWKTVDNGTSGFSALTDVDMSGKVDFGDVATVLTDYGTSKQDTPPPPIDCTINAPR
jgi:hypothetical protein